MKRDENARILLPESEIPKFWYNIAADFKNPPAPYFDAQSKGPADPAALAAIFPMTMLQQELSAERYSEIPGRVRDMYKAFRPSPVIRARALEAKLGTSARIYYKFEGGNATCSHKLNTALAQAYFNKEAGVKRLSTETGAGQWGCALSLACNRFDLECLVYMVKVSYQQKPYRRTFMNLFGADVLASPSETTESGRAILAADPDCTGSLGIAIGEAVEDALKRADTNYSLGSVLNHVILHQTVIGQEAKKQLESVDEYPDVVIACCGGGSNFGGIAFPFLQDRLTGKSKVRALAVEPESCPTLTKGVYAFDYGDTAHFAPIAKMYTLGAGFVPSPSHAGGLRYHGASPLVSQLYSEGEIEAAAYGQKSVFDAAALFARAEGIVPAPESSHAIKGAIEEALDAKEKGEERVILFCLSGAGYFDMTAYETYFSGDMQERDFKPEAAEKALRELPEM
jgi:tryptophan synthase beta chain